MTDNIKVMVVDDSRYMNEFLSDVISSPKIEVTHRAFDGYDAIRKIKRDKPDVILLDLEMPHMDGLSFLEKIMKEEPIPVIVVSSYGQLGSEIIFDALECGAVDFVPLTLEEPQKHHGLRDDLISKIKAAAGINPNLLTAKGYVAKRLRQKTTHDSAQKVVIIGASTGGPRIISQIMANLPSTFAAGLLIVQHMPVMFTRYFAHHLDNKSDLKVKEATTGDNIEQGLALVAPSDSHLVVNKSHKVQLNDGPKRLGARPSINVTMVSASEAYGPNTIGVLLSGMGHDGAFGMKMIKKRGGITIAQDEKTSVIFGMAKAACDLKAVDKLIPTDNLTDAILEAVEKND